MRVTQQKTDGGIITHADQDHIACFAGDGSNPSLFARFDVGTIIDFPLTNKKLLTDGFSVRVTTAVLSSKNSQNLPNVHPDISIRQDRKSC